MNSDALKELTERVAAQVKGAALLNVAYMGVAAGLLDACGQGEASAEGIAARAGKDRGYVERWCDTAYAFGLLDEVRPDVFVLTELGAAFRPSAPGTLMPFAVQSVLGAHMLERATTLSASGERPGESVLAERPSVLPWFGPMLEHSFGGLLESTILPGVPAFAEVDQHRGLAVDLGCGNGWYLRRMAKRYPHLRGIGLDGFDENIRQAKHQAEKEGLADRLSFSVGDIYHFNVAEPVSLIAMTRALHHVWDQKDRVFAMLRDHLKPGGFAVIWEPNWPAQRTTLRDPKRSMLAFQNLSEHVQGNHFLRVDEIAAEFERVGMETQIHLFQQQGEAVVVGRRR